MVQSKKQSSCKPKFAEVIIGDKEAKEKYEATNSRPRRNPYLKLNYPNGVTLVLPADIGIVRFKTKSKKNELWKIPIQPKYVNLLEVNI